MKKIALICMFTLLISATFIQAQNEVKLFDSPVDPQTYLIRPGDELLITFISSKQTALTLVVDPEGNIVNETIGIFNLQNRTLAYAKSQLVTTLKQLYKVENIEVSIKAPREVSIAVYGSVVRPGIYKGLTSERVSSIITKAGGILPNGSTRNIVFSGGGNESYVDLDKSIYLGDIEANPHLYAGFSINVPSKSSKKIQIAGDVNFPREIELKDGDNLDLLIQLAGGYKNSVSLSDIHIIRENKYIDKNDVQRDDVILVKSSTVSSANTVKLFGAVQNQGSYPFVENMTLSNLLSTAGGYEAKANKDLTTIFRKPHYDSHGNKSDIRYPISKPLQLTENAPIRLSVDDSVFVPWQVGFIKISGSILNPGYFPYQANENILYYINSAGGFLPTANKDEILIFNPISRNTTTVNSGIISPDGAEIIIQLKEELK